MPRLIGDQRWIDAQVDHEVNLRSGRMAVKIPPSDVARESAWALCTPSVKAGAAYMQAV